MKKINTIELEKIIRGVKCGTVGAMAVAVNAFASTFAHIGIALADICWDNYAVPVTPEDNLPLNKLKTS